LTPHEFRELADQVAESDHHRHDRERHQEEHWHQYDLGRDGEDLAHLELDA
jgi:hypothetical protein